MQSKRIITTTDKFKGNPRTISKKQFELLKEHIEYLGDLSGVVYCHNNKAYVGGNQRSEVFNGSPIEISNKYDPPTRAKTVADGFVLYNCERYAYREVVFTEDEFKMACIVANNDGGEWDMDILYNEWDTELLKTWGMDIEFPALEPEAGEDEPIDKNTLSLLVKDVPNDELIALFEELKERGYTCEIKN